ncbi:MAG TPA: PPC domain-containing DNA-binding protein [Gemmatimonadota bacterium]|nr:PPC domain-containing DNA-binding protein [Gemmatimonadota bacterium]
MKAKLLRDGYARVHALVFDVEDEAIATLTSFAEERAIEAAHFSAIGAFREAVIAFFDWDSKSYKEIPVDEPVEVAAMAGNVGRKDGAVRVHAHVVLGRRDGTALAGHLVSGRVRPTLEMMFVEERANLVRTIDEASTLPLLDVGP